MASLQAQFLVASPQLADPNFYRSVVLMVEHNTEGALGVILNRPSDRTIAGIGDLIGEEFSERGDLIYIGGPVAGPLLAIHAEEDLADSRVMPDLFVSSRRERIVELIRRGESMFRLFLGYSGWGNGQLDGELQRGGWLTTSASVDEVFSDCNTIWERMARRINLQILASIVDAGDAPRDATLN
jgi:putative transcriptional regulator